MDIGTILAAVTGPEDRLADKPTTILILEQDFKRMRGLVESLDEKAIIRHSTIRTDRGVGLTIDCYGGLIRKDELEQALQRANAQDN